MNSKHQFLCGSLVAILNIALAQDEIRCYHCGYMETHTGERVKIPSRVEDIPFCGEDALNFTTGTPTINAPQVL